MSDTTPAEIIDDIVWLHETVEGSRIVKVLAEAGYIIVPKEPTEAMDEAGYRAIGATHYSPKADEGWQAHARAVYRAMTEAHKDTGA